MQKILQEIHRGEWLKIYFSKIVDERPIIAHKVSLAEFTNVMISKNICYIAGYLTGFRKKTTATYAKYLTIEAEKRLSAKGYGYVSMNVRKKHRYYNKNGRFMR